MDSYPAGRAMEQMNEVQSLWIVFAIMACGLIIYRGFKKNTSSGVINSAVVGGILYLYIAVPGAQSIIAALFAVFIIFGAISFLREVL